MRRVLVQQFKKKDGKWEPAEPRRGVFHGFGLYDDGGEAPAVITGIIVEYENGSVNVEALSHVQFSYPPEEGI